VSGAHTPGLHWAEILGKQQQLVFNSRTFAARAYELACLRAMEAAARAAILKATGAQS
jgi:hypothetical protein